MSGFILAAQTTHFLIFQSYVLPGENKSVPSIQLMFGFFNYIVHVLT